MSRYTHWKQTVFYLNNELAVSQGEQIGVHLKCGPNEKNPRDLDITIAYDFKGATGSAKDVQEYRLR